MWQPIETAPKDGTRFLGYIPEGINLDRDNEDKPEYIEHFLPVHWWGGNKWYEPQFKVSSVLIGDRVTHWMPLPEPPKEK